MSNYRPYKFIVTPVVQVLDADGNVVDEGQGEPVTVYGCDALEQWAREFPDNLAKAAPAP